MSDLDELETRELFFYQAELSTPSPSGSEPSAMNQTLGLYHTAYYLENLENEYYEHDGSSYNATNFYSGTPSPIADSRLCQTPVTPAVADGFSSGDIRRVGEAGPSSPPFSWDDTGLVFNVSDSTPPAAATNCLLRHCSAAPSSLVAMTAMQHQQQAVVSCDGRRQALAVPIGSEIRQLDRGQQRLLDLPAPSPYAVPSTPQLAADVPKHRRGRRPANGDADPYTRTTQRQDRRRQSNRKAAEKYRVKMKEQNDVMKKEKDDLNNENRDMRFRIKTLEEQIRVKDQEIARLKAIAAST